MTNLEIIKYLAHNNPARLAELIDDIYCTGWNCGAYAAINDSGIFSDHEIDDFYEWINQEASGGFFIDYEIAEWAKIVGQNEVKE